MSFFVTAARRLTAVVFNAKSRNTTNANLFLTGLESLEDRCLLATAVTFNSSGNNLTVVGTRGDDCLEVAVDIQGSSREVCGKTDYQRWLRHRPVVYELVLLELGISLRRRNTGG